MNLTREQLNKLCNNHSNYNWYNTLKGGYV